jgi:hypothetical protein
MDPSTKDRIAHVLTTFAPTSTGRKHAPNTHDYLIRGIPNDLWRDINTASGEHNISVRGWVLQALRNEIVRQRRMRAESAESAVDPGIEEV